MQRSLEFAGVSFLPASEMHSATKTRKSVNELELGLSFGHKVKRIVTAEDFSSLRSSDSPLSSNSSVSSSSSGGLGDEADEGRFRRSDAVCCSAMRSANSASHSQVVGWPPIRTCRRNNLVNISRVPNSDMKATAHEEIPQSCSSNFDKKGVGTNDANDCDRKAIRLQKSRFVKVNMDGDPIGRKVDLHTHVSYEALALALEAMFHKPTLSLNASNNGMFSKLLDGSSEFSLIYEDEDGDWMLVGDVPWRMFLRTVKRLRIMKTMDACGLDLQMNQLMES